MSLGGTVESTKVSEQLCYKQSANVDRIKFMPSDVCQSLYAYSIITCIF